MANKYLGLEEAAEQLGISSDELKRLRERGDIRGFADRGTWKFKREDVDELGRHRKPDSDPDVSIIHSADTDENISIFTDDDDLGEQATTIRQEPESGEFSDELLGSGPTSDSDVRLILDDGLLSGADSDDDVELPSLKDSDSDVRLVDDRHDLIAGSDSDVKLVGDDSDSDVQLVTGGGTVDDDSDSDVKLVSGDEAGTSSAEIALFADSDEIELVDSGLALDEESGISLGQPADSGISLESVDSGITLDNEESGIRLGGAEDSGIALEPAASGEDTLHHTIPMLEIAGEDVGEDTSFEVPSMEIDEEESVFELEALGTAVPAEKKKQRTDDDTFDLDTVDDFGDDLEVDDDLLGEDDDLDVFEGDDEFEDTFESGESHPEFAAPYGRGVAAPASEWGVGSVIGLGMSTLVMTLCSMVMFDLVRTMWKWDEASAVNGPIINIVSGLF